MSREQTQQTERDNSSQPTSGSRDRAIALAAAAGEPQAMRPALTPLLSGFAAAIAVVQDLFSQNHSQMAEILHRCTALQGKQAARHYLSGKVLVAAPHPCLLINPNGSQAAAAALGIPRAAVAEGIAADVLPLPENAAQLIHFCWGERP